MPKGRLVVTGFIGKGKRRHILKTPNIAYCGRAAIFRAPADTSLKSSKICINCRVSYFKEG